MDEKVIVYQKLSHYFDEICNSSITMSYNLVSKLLQFMSKQSTLMQFIAKCNQGLNYKNLLSESIESKVFKMPKSKKEIICLVTGILFDCDQFKMELMSFCDKYFGASTMDEGYKVFCNVVIRGYQDAFQLMFYHFDDDGERDKIEETLMISDKTLYEQVFPLVGSLYDCVKGDNGISEAKRREYFIMLEGLEYAFEISSSKMISAIWLGLKSVFNGYKNGNSYILTIDKVLAAHTFC